MNLCGRTQCVSLTSRESSAEGSMCVTINPEVNAGRGKISEGDPWVGWLCACVCMCVYVCVCSGL